MNIIFGRDQAEAMDEKYTVLELDTIRLGNDGPELVAFCIVENIPIMDLPQVENMKKLHANLLVEYRKQNWNYCEQALEYLTGFWAHELDSFYEHLKTRIDNYKTTAPEEGWNGVIQRDAV